MIYYVYLMPYLRAGKTCYYCGYTNNPQRRENEHCWDNRYKWCGELRVIDLVFYTGHFDSQREAMKAERDVKRKSARVKRAAYNTAGASP